MLQIVGDYNNPKLIDNDLLYLSNSDSFLNDQLQQPRV